MTLPPGTRLGPYEISARIGMGGMGEVYKARDTRLDRTVAIKVLPPHVAADPVRRQRFEHEARTVGALHHPHICILHDVGRHDEVDYIVLEYLDGETLADRLAAGAMPLDLVLRFAVQIASALHNAHRQGITHRDIKPANVIVTKDGAKLLDFGLAKQQSAAVAGELSQFPTVNNALTAEGTLLGTLQYMAPEQLEGKEVDARTDVFGFGALVYEIATGRKAFSGSNQASVIAAIMSSEPPAMSALQPIVPHALDRIVRRCLAKDPEDRWQTMRDVELELKSIAEQPSTRTPPAEPRRRVGLVSVLAVTTLTLAAVTAYLVSRPREERSVRLSVPLPETVMPFAEDPFPAISPDGRYIAFLAPSGTVYRQLWLRALDAGSAEPIAGTEYALGPFWSPDSGFIGFFAGGKLKRVAVSRGVPEVIADALSQDQATGGSAGTWNASGQIIFGHSGTGSGSLYLVSASGGTPSPLIAPERPRQTRLAFPRFLPDGRRFFYVAFGPQPAVYLASLDTDEKRPLSVPSLQVLYSASGYLLHAREGRLLAQRFDIARGELVGEAAPVLDQLVGAFSVSDDGSLAFSAGGDRPTLLTWVDRAGKQIGVVETTTGRFRYPWLLADGQHVAVERITRGVADIWVLDVTRGTGSPLTLDGGRIPLGSPDGKKVTYLAVRKGRQGMYQKAVNGSGDEEFLVENAMATNDWSADGRFILFRRDTNARDLWALPLMGDRKPFPILESRFNEDMGRFSPDGHWIAYVSDESGTDEVYVQRFPVPDGKRQVSRGGGFMPRWRSDGRELLYTDGQNTVVSVDVKLGQSAEIGSPRVLFQLPTQIVGARWASTADADRFLLPLPGRQPPMTVLTNWLATLKR